MDSCCNQLQEVYHNPYFESSIFVGEFVDHEWSTTYLDDQKLQIMIGKLIISLFFCNSLPKLH